MKKKILTNDEILEEQERILYLTENLGVKKEKEKAGI